MSSLKDILLRIKDFTKSRSIDIAAELSGMCKTKDGIVSIVAFRQWASSIGINLSNSSIQLLIASFKRDGGVDVNELCNAIQNIDGSQLSMKIKQKDCTKQLQELARDLASTRSNLKDIFRPYDRMKNGKVSVFNFYRCLGDNPVTRTISDTYSEGDDIDIIKLDEDLKEASKTINVARLEVPEPTDAFIALARFIKFNNIDIAEKFAEIDKMNKGKIPKKQFYLVISSVSSRIPQSGYVEITENFEDGPCCNYKLFLEALNQIVVPPRIQNNKEEICHELNDVETPEYLIQSIKKIIENRRIDPKDYFPLDEEEISYNRFLRGISVLQLGLKPKEIKTIFNEFQNENGNIKLHEFLKAITYQKNIEKINPKVVVERLRNYLYETRQQLYPSIRRFDRESSGYVSYGQLISSLNFVKFDFTNAEAAAIKEGFPGPFDGTVNWKLLCNQCDQEIRKYKSDIDVLEQNQQTTYTQPPINIIQILYVIYKCIKSGNLDIYSEMKRKDRYRDSSINQQIFINIISSLPIQISLNDLRTIISYYRITGSQDINYEKFNVDICHCEETLQKQRDPIY